MKTEEKWYVILCIVLMVPFLVYGLHNAYKNKINKTYQNGLNVGASYLYEQMNDDLKKQLKVEYNVEQRKFYRYVPKEIK